MDRQKLPTLLRSAGLTIHELAARARISEETLQAWTRGEKGLSAERQVRLFLTLYEAHEERRESQVSGTCEWRDQFTARVLKEASSGRVPDESGYDEHVRSCLICSAHDAWHAANPLPLDLPPEPLWLKAFGILATPAMTDNLAVPLVVGAAGIATALGVRLILPASPYWEVILWPASCYVGVVVGIACYRVLSTMIGNVGVRGWLARLGAWTFGMTLAMGIPITAGSPSLEDALDPRFGIPGLIASMALMTLLFSIFMRE